MIIKKKDISKYLNQTLDLTINFQASALNDIYLRDLFVSKYQLTIHKDQLTVLIEGKMICPCAISNQDVEVDLFIDEVVSLNSEAFDQINYEFDSELDSDEIAQILIKRYIPMQVVKNDKIVYPRGDGWEVLSECAYQSQKTIR